MDRKINILIRFITPQLELERIGTIKNTIQLMMNGIFLLNSPASVS